MKLVGVMPVRNEAWVLGLSARVALKWVDELLILLHACTDDSQAIIEQIGRENPGRMWMRTVEGDKWDEMQHRQMLLDRAREIDATHIAIIDADEVLTGNLIDYVKHGGMVANVPPGSCLQLPGYNLRARKWDGAGEPYISSLERYHGNGVWGKRWFSVAFVDDPRLSWSGDKFHSREPLYPEHRRAQLKPYQPVAQGQGGVMHLWGASERRLIAKHALYKLTERLRFPDRPVEHIDKMYSWAIKGDPTSPSWGTPDTWTYEAVPNNWWDAHADLLKYLDVDAEPWQEAEIIRILKEHGPRKFQGLDLFGLA